MKELLFIELGAVVTEILGSRKCTIEPFCDPDPKKAPTYKAENRIEIDFVDSLEYIMENRGLDSVEIAIPRVQYDHYIQTKDPDQINSHDSKRIGPRWPSGGYEGIVTIRKEVVDAKKTLADAAKALPGQPYEYQVVTLIDDATGVAVQRYHGFHAQIVKKEGDILWLDVAHAGASLDQSSPRKTIPYDPADTTRFYAGKLVAESVLGSSHAPGSSGAVFITLEEAARLGVEEPKLPPGAGGTPDGDGGEGDAGGAHTSSLVLSYRITRDGVGSAVRAEVYFVLLLANVLNVRGSMDPTALAVRLAMFDHYNQIGPGWPGDSYEGLMYIREDVVKANAALAMAVAMLPGCPWEHQAVVVTDEVTGTVQRYHGFHAEIVEDRDNILTLEIANAGTSAGPSSPRKTIRYDPTDMTKFYAGALVVENVVRSGQAPGSSGAVFITPEAAESFGMEVPALLPWAEAAASFIVKLPELTPGSEEMARLDVLLPTVPHGAQAAKRFDVPRPSHHLALGSDTFYVRGINHG